MTRGSCTLAWACFTAYVSNSSLLLCRCYTCPSKFSLRRFNPISFTTVEDTRSYVVGQEEKKTVNVIMAYLVSNSMYGILWDLDILLGDHRAWRLLF